VRPEDAIVLIRTANTLRATRGSGFAIGDGSWIVTASHVVSADVGKGRRAWDRTAFVYSPWTGRPYEARVVAVDGVADIALLRMPQAGFPALPLENPDLKDASAALNALKDRPVHLFGFPLSYGEDTIAALARPEHNDSRLREIAKRGDTNLCVLNACPDVQPGWSGGPMVSGDRGAVIAVFHSLYRPKAGVDEGFPAGSLTGYLVDLLRQAGAGDLAPFAQVAAPTVPKPADAAERMAHEMRSLSWSAVGNWKKAEEEQRDLIKMAPGDGLPHAELGRLLREEGRLPEAIKELREAVRLAPHSMTANLYLGRALHLDYDPKGASTALDAAVEASPGEVEPQLALAEVYEDSQKADQAEALLRKLRESNPTHPGVLYRLGELLLRARPAGPGREEGMAVLAEAAALAVSDPGLSFIAVAYARALDNARKPKQAEEFFHQILRGDPQSAEAHYYLAVLLLRQNRVDEAQVQVNLGIMLPRLSEAMVEAFRALQLRVAEKAASQK
jgi:tetratricopeptide (TPR) repeat protein